MKYLEIRDNKPSEPDPIPAWIKDSIERYVKDKQPITSEFLRACLHNNLKEAFIYADSYNVKIIGTIVNYLYQDIPARCWGSKEKVDAWLCS